MAVLLDQRELRRALSEVDASAKTDLQELLKLIDPDDVAWSRQVIAPYLTDLVNEYGGAIEDLMVENFMEGRDLARVPGLYTPQYAPDVTEAQVSSNLFDAFGSIIGPDANVEAAKSRVQGITTRLTQQRGRQAIDSNVRRDKAALGYARVPRGTKTCGWCLMLASRGPVYGTSQDAGGSGNRFHNECHCIVTAVFDKETEIEGYDPDSLTGIYEQAKKNAKSSDPRDIMREMDKITGHK